MHGAVQVIAGAVTAPVLLTCEHASARLPDPWRWPQSDRWLCHTHWAYDLGAAELCGELAARLRATAVLADFTRLLIDPNRPPESPTLFRERADGQPVALNQHLDAEDRLHRHAYWAAYHEEVDRQVGAARAPTLLAVHTFTPVYQGEQRSYELGVLFDEAEVEATGLATLLERGLLDVRLNEPYSGRGGFIYSVDRHARRHGRVALELEVRQDRVQDGAFRRRLVELLATWGCA